MLEVPEDNDCVQIWPEPENDTDKNFISKTVQKKNVIKIKTPSFKDSNFLPPSSHTQFFPPISFTKSKNLKSESPIWSFA